MKKDFKLLMRLAVDEIAALANCPYKTAKREFVNIYKDAVKQQKSKRRKPSRVNSEDRCGW